MSACGLQVQIIFSLLCGSSSALEAVPLAEHKDGLDSFYNYDVVNGVVVSDHSLGRPKALDKSMDHRPKAINQILFLLGLWIPAMVKMASLPSPGP